MIHVALYQPEIPPNTGNIIRLCANTGATLHLIHPLGFDLSDKRARRAGLDYKDLMNIRHHDDYAAFLASCESQRVFAFTTKARTYHSNAAYQSGDILLFGPETRGLPDFILSSLPEQQKIRLPMQPDSRSLNLSNAVAIGVYESWRQLGFTGCREQE